MLCGAASLRHGVEGAWLLLVAQPPGCSPWHIQRLGCVPPLVPAEAVLPLSLALPCLGITTKTLTRSVLTCFCAWWVVVATQLSCHVRVCSPRGGRKLCVCPHVLCVSSCRRVQRQARCGWGAPNVDAAVAVVPAVVLTQHLVAPRGWW
jgi:hypothetical protein